MSKKEVLAAFETVITDPGSIKSGEYLEDHILSYAKKFLDIDRLGLIGALCEWIYFRSEPRTMLAVRVAKELGLREVSQVIEVLRREVAAGKVFPSFYLRDIDDALSSLTPP
jgi:hypothetical protein